MQTETATDRRITLRISRHIPFPAERVFDAWLDPKLAAKWLFATDGGEMTQAEADPRIGGKFAFTEKRDGEGVLHTGEYLEIERPRRLVFSFGVPKYSPEFDRVSVEIEPQGSACQLTLTHEVKPEWETPTRAGWAQILEGLAASLGDPRAATNRKHGENIAPRTVRLVRLLPGPIERVWSHLVEGEKRSHWLASGDLDLTVGSKIHWHFRHKDIAPDEEAPEDFKEDHEEGHEFAGEVLACDAPRLLKFRWDDVPEGSASEVTFELKPKGGDVELTLTHLLLADAPKTLRGVSGGWHTHVTFLVAQLTGDTAPSFWPTFERLRKEYGKRLGVE